MAADIFESVRQEEFSKVLNALEQDWPKHFLLHQIITTFREYKEAGSTWEQYLYIYGTFESGVYLNIISSETYSRVNVYTASSDLTEMKKALMETNLIPWHQENFIFEIIDNRFLGVMQEVFATKHGKFEISSDNMFLYPPNKELHIQPLPEDVYIENLDESYAAEMDKNWPHRYPGSELVHKNNLRYNFGLGIFRRSDKKLLSSSLSNHTGGVFVLHTDLECRGKGYAAIVVQHMVQECRRRGRIPFCTVIIGNKPSERLFTKLGFEKFTLVDYVILLSNTQHIT
uniref:N-acetyltransferase domain-containing protein n=1 Tax=Cuerna arida TaxID=1464854 RepID=A0A1B6GCV6_9HEMI